MCWRDRGSRQAWVEKTEQGTESTSDAGTVYPAENESIGIKRLMRLSELMELSASERRVRKEHEAEVKLWNNIQREF